MTRAAALCLVALACGCCPAPRINWPKAPTAEPQASAIEGEQELRPGLAARYVHLFDHDELEQAVAVEGGVVARTSSGNLVRFDTAYAGAGEAVLWPPVAALAAGPDGSLVAALDDGTLVSVDPRTLAIKRIGAVGGKPVWLALHRDRLIVVAEAAGDKFLYRQLATDPSRDARPLLIPAPRFVGARWVIDDDRLWYADAVNGGGWAGSIDLATGAPGLRLALPPGAYNLIARGGAVWAYGGVRHFAGGIEELRPDRGRRLWDQPDNNPLAAPITRIVEVRGRLLVILGNKLHDVSDDLATWTEVAALPPRVGARGPDPTDAYPTITDAITIGDDLVLATRQDGLVLVRGGVVEPRGHRDLLAGSVFKIIPSGGRLHAGTSVALHRHGIAGDPLRLPDLSFKVHGVAIAGTPGGPPYVVMDSNLFWPGRTTATARWDPGGLTVLGQQVHGPVARHVVAIGDDRRGPGGLWAFEDHAIWRWRDATARWEVVGAYADDVYVGSGWLDPVVALDGSPVDAGDGWLIHDGYGTLLRLVAPPGSPTAALVRVLPGTRVDDAIAWSSGSALLVIDGQVAAYDAAGGRMVPFDLPPLPEGITHLALDRAGHLWLTTATGLHVVDGDQVHAVSLPALVGRPIVDLAPDPSGGVAAALGDRGFLAVWLEPRPSSSDGARP